MNILTIIIKKKYFHQILRGEKTEEYRLIKRYWKNIIENGKYTHIRFKNGYNDNCPQLLIEYKGYEKLTIRHEFFGEYPVEVYVLKLGKIISCTVAVIEKNLELQF